MYQSILLAVDGSEHSKRAAKEAATIAAAMRAEVTILYVVDHEDSTDEVYRDVNTTEVELNRQKKILPAQQALSAKDVFYKVEILHGRPGPTIVEYVNNGVYDLVIMGSRGMNPVRAMLGSVSQKVLSLAKCPVLIVK